MTANIIGKWQEGGKQFAKNRIKKIKKYIQRKWKKREREKKDRNTEIYEYMELKLLLNFIDFVLHHIFK